MPRFAVVGHVEWVDFLTVPHVPLAGEIVHADKWWSEAAGGGAVAAVQLAKLAGTATFFTALGNDDHARRAERGAARVMASRSRRRSATVPSGAAVALLDARGERTIVVQGERLVPAGDDDLPWDRLAEMDGVYFTGGDAASLRAARAARTLVATPRARDALTGSDVTLDALVRSAGDAGEQDDPERHGWSARLTVATRGPDGGTYTTGDGQTGSFEAAPLPGPVVDAYGAGDSFAAGLTFGLGSGMDVDAALALAARCGAGNLTGAGPYAGTADRGGLGPVTAMVSPSGEQIEIALGDQRAVVVEVGGGLRDVLGGGPRHSRRIRGRRDVPLGTRAGADALAEPAAGRQLRVRGRAAPAHARRTGRAATRSTASSAGLAGRSPSASPHRVVDGAPRSIPGPAIRSRSPLQSSTGCPTEGLVVQTTATNVGSRACPFGTGAHPYLSAGTPTVDSAVLHVPAGTVLQANERGIPVGEMRRSRAPTTTSGSAGRSARPCWTTASPISSATATGSRAWSCSDADGGGLSLWVDEALPLPDAVHGRPAARRRPPQPRRRADDMPPNAFRTGRDLIRLEPGQSVTSTWGIHPLDIGDACTLAQERRSGVALSVSADGYGSQAPRWKVDRGRRRSSPPTCWSCSASPATSRR